jgi:alkylated DNA repair dioxygenase AlkB
MLMATVGHLKDMRQSSLPPGGKDSNGVLPAGLRHLPGRLGEAAQRELVALILRAAEAAPWLTPTMPRTGRPFSVRMTNMGPLGWVSDRAGW